MAGSRSNGRERVAALFVALVVLPSLSPDLFGLACPHHAGHGGGGERPAAHHDGGTAPSSGGHGGGTLPSADVQAGAPSAPPPSPTAPSHPPTSPSHLPAPCTCAGNCPVSPGPTVPSPTTPVVPSGSEVRPVERPTAPAVPAPRTPFLLPYANGPPTT